MMRDIKVEHYSPSEVIVPGSFFCWEEMCYSLVANANGILNNPPENEKQAIRQLVANLLDPLRRACDKPIHITSGYRNEKLNRIVGGKPGSQHLRGEAADLYIPEGPFYLLEVLQDNGLVFDQAIAYHHRRFLHLSYKSSGGNRNEIIHNY